MTHSFQCNRKQKRENECEELGHFVPAAKRIKIKNFKDIQPIDYSSEHIFHVNNNMPSFALTNKNEVFHQPSDVSNNVFQRDIAQCSVLQTEVDCIAEEYAAIHQSNFKYLPDLSAAENPHYYENNKILFELYVARVQRSVCNSVSTSHQYF